MGADGETITLSPPKGTRGLFELFIESYDKNSAKVRESADRLAIGSSSVLSTLKTDMILVAVDPPSRIEKTFDLADITEGIVISYREVHDWWYEQPFLRRTREELCGEDNIEYQEWLAWKDSQMERRLNRELETVWEPFENCPWLDR